MKPTYKNKSIQTKAIADTTYRNVLDDVGDFVLLLDGGGAICWANRTLWNALGYAPEDALAAHLFEVVAPEDTALCAQALEGLVGDCQQVALNLMLIGKQGVKISTAGQFCIWPERGDDVRIYAILRAQDARGKSEHVLRIAVEKAESASLAKSEYLANMSHEIRTPLNAILGLSDLALHTQSEVLRTEHLRSIGRSGRALIGLIDNILDLSKIEAGKFELERIPFLASEIVESIAILFAPQARDKGVDLKVDIDAAVPSRLLGDPGRLRQVLFNIVANAVKFTESGCIEVRLNCARLADARVELRAAVSDSGIGIATDQLKDVFDAFAQADTSIVRRYGGSGLGLDIASRLVAMMGGKIWVESEVGKGSTFYFTALFELPESPGDSGGAAAPSSVAVAPSHLHVLLVEDDDFNQLVARGYLERQGYLVSSVNNGAEALEALEGARFDAILMDVQMPVMDGYAATQHIRQRERHGGQHIPIIGLTAHALKGDRERALEVGMDAYLSKPIEAEQLYAVLDSALRCIKAPGEKSAQTGVVDLDYTALLARFAGDSSLLDKTIDSFLRDCDFYRQRLQEAVERADGQALLRAAHDLKGPAGTLGLRALHQMAVELEAMGRSNAPALTARVCARLHAEFAAARSALAQLHHS